MISPSLLNAAEWSGMFMNNQNDLVVTLSDLTKLLEGARYAVIDGMAVSALVSPRATQDIDILVESEIELEIMVSKLAPKFNRNRGHAMEHKKTGVEIEILTPEFISIDKKLASYSVEKALEKGLGGVPAQVAPPEAIIALKMQRNSAQDVADVLRLLLSYPLAKESAIILGASEERLTEIESMERPQLPDNPIDDPIV